MNKLAITQYNYDLKKSMMPGFLVKGVKIDDSWVSRCKRYMGDEGCDLAKLVSFIRRGLVDARSENFAEQALDESLSVAQQWLILHLCLKDGVPEWVRDEEKDELTPELKVPEPGTPGFVASVVGSAGNTIAATMRPVQSLTAKKTEVNEQDEQNQE